MQQLGKRGDTTRRYRFLFALLLTLSGCSAGDHDTALVTYLRKLAAALPDTPLMAASSDPTGFVAGDFEPIDIDADADADGSIDIIDLRGCDLQRTVIREQSRLGQTAKPSQRLLLVVEYLRLAPNCVRQLRRQGDRQLAASLEHAWERRRRNLPTYVFNATLGSAEYRALWSAEPAPMGYPGVGRSRTIAALVAIDRQSSRWLGGDYSAPDRDFELLLGEVAGGAAGELLHSLYAQVELLAGADRRLREQLQQDPTCTRTTNRREAARLMAAARRHFDAEVLPDVMDAYRQMTALLAPVAALEARLETALPKAYPGWRATRDRQVEAAAVAPPRHRALLARAVQACASR